MVLEEQVQELDKASSEKDTLIEKYKIEYKEGNNANYYIEKGTYIHVCAEIIILVSM